MSSIDSQSAESEHTDSAARLNTPAPRRSHRKLLAVGLGLAAALIVTAIIFFFMVRNNAPRLTQADYDAAVERWEKNGPADYDLDLELSGHRTGTIHVEVRHGEV